MQISKTNNVVFLKDVESNIIQEAFVVLKDNVKFETHSKMNDTSQKRDGEINILKEAENLINQEINVYNLKYDKYKISKLEKKLTILKIVNIFCIVAIISSIIIK